MNTILSTILKVKKVALFSIFIFLLQSCANIVPPSGGKKDETPPILLSSKPADSSLNKRISKIDLRFNKYMVIKDLEKNLQFSPLLPIEPTVIAYGKKVEIKIVDSFLEDNTTYQLSLGNALVDNREATPYKNYTYTFSTGAYFDSLKIHGRVFDAQTGLPDSSVTIMLYKSTASDSSILKNKPFYVQKTDGSGNFTLAHLPSRSFKVFAVKDDNNNNLYDFGTEEIDFLDSVITPNIKDSNALIFHVFKEMDDTAKIKHIDTSTTSKTENDRISRFGKKEKEPDRKPERKQEKGQEYKVLVDTSSLTTRTFDISKNLTIDLFRQVQLDTSKIYLSFDDKGIEVEAVQRLLISDSTIVIKANWLADKVYTLRLIKGWAKDTSGAELPPGKYLFRTKSKDDYGNLKIKMDTTYINENFVLVLLKGNDSIFQKLITTSTYTIPFLNEGDYTLRIFKDENNNGKWDPGSLFKKRHAEKVIPYTDKIIIKNGWDNEIDFKVPLQIENMGKEPDKKGRFLEK